MSIVSRLLGTAERENGDDATDDIDGDPLEAGLDEMFYLVSNARRRYVIDFVGDLDRGESVSLDVLTDGLAFVENDEFDRIEDVDGQARKRVYVSLYQTHIPVLEEAGAIRWPVGGKEIAPTTFTTSLKRLVRAGYIEASHSEVPA